MTRSKRASLLVALVATAFLGGLATLLLWPPSHGGSQADAGTSTPSFFSSFLEQASGGGSATTGGTGITCAAGTCNYDATKLLQTYYEFVDDKCGGNTGLIGPFSYSASGTGAAHTQSQAVGGDCIYTASTGTTNTGRAATMANAGIGWGSTAGMTFCYDTVASITTLSDGSETHQDLFGFGDSSSALPTDGAFFEHSGTGTTWGCRNRSGGAGAVTDSGVTITPGQSYYLEVCLNATTNATYRIGVGTGAASTVCTLSSNMPAVSTTSVGMQLVKSVGTTARTVVVDFERVRIGRAAARFTP